MSVNSFDDVYELFLQVWRECEFDKGYYQGYNEGYNEGYKEGYDEIRKEIALKMMEDSIDDETIQICTGFSTQQFQESNDKTSVSGFIH